MTGFTSPLAEIAGPTRNVGLDDVSLIQEHIPGGQYLTQWGEEHIRLAEQTRLAYFEGRFREVANQYLVTPPAGVLETPATHQHIESTEMSWLVDHAEEAAQLKGEWLLINGAELIAHNRNFARIRALVAERGIRSPFVYYVPTDDESIAITI